jgi:hypothetical protein
MSAAGTRAAGFVPSKKPPKKLFLDVWKPFYGISSRLRWRAGGDRGEHGDSPSEREF